MSANAGDIFLSLRTNSAEFLNELRSIGQGINTFQSQMQRQFDSVTNGLKNIAAGVSIGAVFHKMVEEAEQAETATRKIEQVLRSTGGVAGITAREVDRVASSLSKLTGIDDDAIKGGQALLLTFKGIGKDVFPQATKAMLDMSAAMGQDMKSSAIQLGKALNDPAEGLSALHRVGVTFTAGQEAAIKAMQKAGDVAGAQKIILQELESEFGNMSLAARDTLAGAFQALQTSTDNLFEAFGTSGSSGLRYGIEFAITLMNKLGTETVPQIVGGFNVVASAIKPVTDGLGAVAKVALNAALTFNKSWIEAFTFVGEAWNMFIHGQMTPNIASEMIKEFSSSLLQNFQTDFVGEAQKKLAEIGKETEARMAMLRKASEASIARSPGYGDGPDKEAEKAEKKHQQELKQLAEIEASLRNRLQTEQAITSGNKDRVAALQAEEKIARLSTLSTVERAAALRNITQLERQITAEKEKQKAAEKAAEEAKKREEDHQKDLKSAVERVAQLQQELAKKTAIANLDEEALLRAEAKEKIGRLENLTAEERNQKENELYDILRKIREVDSAELTRNKVKAMRDETAALAAKVSGHKAEYDVMKKLRDIRDDQKLTQSDKDALAGEVMANANAQEMLNEQLDRQKDLLDRVKGGTGSYRDKIRELQSALNDGTINQKQFNEALKDLNNKHIKDVTKSVTDFTRTTLKGFTDAIASGKSLKDVFKDLGKSIAELAVNKLLIDPIANFIGNAAGSLFGGTMFGGGGSTTAPSIPSGTGFAGNGSGLGNLLGGIPLIGGLFGNKSTSTTTGADPAAVMGFLARHSIGDAWKVFIVGGAGFGGGGALASGGVPGRGFGSVPGGSLGPIGGGYIPPGIGLPSIPGGVYYPPGGDWSGFGGTQGLMPWQRGGGGAAGGAQAYLSAAQTGQALQRANTAANAETAWMYSQGLISAQQAQTAYQTRQTSQLTQAASGYRMTGAQAYGPPIQTPFIMQGSPYATYMGGGDWASDEMPPLAPDFRKPTGSPFAPSGASRAGTKSYQWSDWDPDPTQSAVARIYGYGGRGYQSSQPGGGGTYGGSGDGLMPFSWGGYDNYVPQGYQFPSGYAHNPRPAGLTPNRYRADGGPVEAGMIYGVNERGREAFIPETAGSVVSNEKLTEVFGGSNAPPSLTFINSSGVDLQQPEVHWDSARRELRAVVNAVMDTAPASKGAKNKRRG
jgi:hypothetical protein